MANLDKQANLTFYNVSLLQYNNIKEVSKMDKTFGQAMKEARKKKGMTQTELASSTSLSRTYLADLEADRYTPGWENVKTIAKSLKINLNSLL
jgi:DNA-binding XRE family transcriptional regulator